MMNNRLHRLPPPPLFTIRPPPKPPGSLFANFQTVEVFNGRCVRSPLDFLNASLSPTNLHKYEETTNWLNFFLFILAVVSVIFCLIIAIFIFICLRKLKKEEKKYKSCVMLNSLTSRKNHQHHHIDACNRTSEHYKCVSNTMNCCEDYYSHQLISMKDNTSPCVLKSNDIFQCSTMKKDIDDQDVPQNHQYECIPEYILTMTRHHHHPSSPVVCHHSHQLCYQTSNTCSVPYNSFSRSYLIPQGVAKSCISDASQCTCSSPPSTTVPQEESSIPLLASTISKESDHIGEISAAKSMMIGWTRRNPSSSTKQKSNDQRCGFLSQLRKSSIL